MAKRIQLVIVGVLSLVVLIFLPQIPGCVMSNLPKVGQVVDQSTGRGLADVTVIASARFNAQSPVHGSARDFPFRILTRTDANGNFRLPNTWSHMRFTLPGLEARETWIITAFKPGYMLVDDLENASKFDSRGRPLSRAWSTMNSPRAEWRVFFVAVEPLQMRKVDLKIEESATYYRDVVSIGRYAGNERSDLDAALNDEAYRFLAPQVCALAPDQSLNAEVGYAFAMFVSDRKKFSDALAALDPAGFGDFYSHPVFHAGSVCQAMKASERQ